MNRSELMDSNVSPEPATPPASSSTAFRHPLRIIRRNIIPILTGALLALLIGAIYRNSLDPTYTATAVLLVDTRQVRALQDAYVFTGDTRDSAETDLASQIELLKSDAIASSIVARYDLAKARESSASQPTLWSRIQNFAPQLFEIPALARTPAVPSQDEITRSAIDNLKGNLSVRRVPRTLVLEISYTSGDPQTAATIANSVAQAYIDDQRLVQKDAARRATDWLNGQLAELKSVLQSADTEIEQYKVSRGLVTTEGGLVQERRLADTNRQLMIAREEVARLATRHDQAQQLLSIPQGQGFTSELISDPLVSNLRTRYLAIVADERAVAGKLGEGHEAVLRLRQQKSEMEQLIQAELKRIASTLNNELDIARSREAHLAAEFERQSALSAQSNEVLIQLRELERRREAYKKIYNDTLQRHQNAMQQQSLDEPSARIITPARMPTQKNGPSALRIFAFAMLIGGALGGGLGLVRELSDRTFRTREQIHAELSIDRAWFLPLLSHRELSRSQRNTTSPPELQDSVRAIAPTPGILSYALAKPGSHFSRTIQAIKLDLDQSCPKKCKRVGITSVLAQEGSITVAKNLASIIAATGAKTLLIDGDITGRKLTKILAPTAKNGLIDASQEHNTSGLGALLFEEQATGLQFLPAVEAADVVFSSDFMAGSAMQTILERAADEFSYILIDLPSLAGSLDVRAIARHLDVIVLVVHWAKTQRDVVTATLTNEPEVQEKCLGVVLNQVDIRQLARYEPSSTIWH